MHSFSSPLALATVALFMLLSTTLADTLRASWILLKKNSSATNLAGFCDYSAFYDSATEKIFYYSGWNNDDYLYDMWSLETNRKNTNNAISWTQESSSAPDPRLAGLALFSSSRRQLVFGMGEMEPEVGDNEIYPLDVFTYSIDTQMWDWTNLSLSNPNLTEGRGWFSSCWRSQAEEEVIVYGGIDNRDYGLNETYMFNMNTLKFEQIVTTGDHPPDLEGHSVALINESMYLYGGYKCVISGTMKQGGVDCFNANIYILNTTSLVWTKLDPETTNTRYAPPQPRCYHSMTFYNNRLYIIGGSFIDPTNVYFFYNDVHVFDVLLSQWVPIIVAGNPPPVAWSRVAVTIPSQQEMWLYGGCNSDDFLDDVYVLQYDVRVEAHNCFVFGEGIETAVAGQPAVFYLQTKEVDDFGEWGSNITWGTNLEFQMFGFADEVGLITVTTVEVGDGFYNASFTPTSGSRFIRLYVMFEGNNVPGSHFNVTKQSAAAHASKSVATGTGTQVVVSGKESSFMVTLFDEYHNQLTTGGQAAQFSLQIGDEDFTDWRVVDGASGWYVITYQIPDTSHSLKLSVMFNGSHIVGSPFIVRVLDNLDISESTVFIIEALTIVTVIATLIGLVLFLLNKNQSQTVRASAPMFVTTSLIGCLIGIGSVLLPATPTDLSCQLFPWMLGIGYALTLAPLVAKNYRVMKIFHKKKLTAEMRWATDRRLMVIVSAYVGVIALILIAWTVFDPLTAHIQHSNQNELLEYMSCSNHNDTIWYLLLIVPLAVTLLFGIHIAMNTQDLPQLFNESKAIVLAVYNLGFTSVFILPLLYTVEDSPTLQYVFKCIAFLWMFGFTAALIFLPKLAAGSTISLTGATSKKVSGIVPNAKAKTEFSTSQLPKEGNVPVSVSVSANLRVVYDDKFKHPFVIET